MIELVAIVCAIIVCVLTPIEVGKIQKGWVRKSFKGSQEQFIAAYRKQLNVMVWLGVVFGFLNIGLGVIEETPGENYVKYFAGLLWFGVSVISYVSRQKLAAIQPSAPTAT